MSYKPCPCCPYPYKLCSPRTLARAVAFLRRFGRSPVADALIVQVRNAWLAIEMENAK